MICNAKYYFLRGTLKMFWASTEQRFILIVHWSVMVKRKTLLRLSRALIMPRAFVVCFRKEHYVIWILPVQYVYTYRLHICRGNFKISLSHLNRKRFDQIDLSLRDKLIANESSKNKELRTKHWKWGTSLCNSWVSFSKWHFSLVPGLTLIFMHSR